jgi:putative two-component system response regulator
MLTRNAELDPSILIVDDQTESIDALRRMLRGAGLCNVSWTTDAREAMELCLWRAPELVLLDLHMPFVTGDEVLARMRQEMPGECYFPVIMLTGDATAEAKRRAFLAGAQDFISKPYQQEEVLLRIHSQLAVGRSHRDLQEQKRELEAAGERTGELEQAELELLDRLARAAEYRDDDTGEHAQRVGRLATRIASELGLPAQAVELIWRAAALHDVGKIGIADDILLKPGKLTPEEMEAMRRHVTIGADILTGGSSRYLRVAERIALTHHEWWDGNGYLGLCGEEIPIEGRIVAVADVYDALTHERPYKAAWRVPDAVAHIVGLQGRQFDPAVIAAFLRVLAADGVGTESSAVA